MITQLTPITAKEANEFVKEYEGVVFVTKVYGMIRKAAKRGANMIYLYAEECTFLNRNVDFCNKLKADGFKVTNNKTTNYIEISW